MTDPEDLRLYALVRDDVHSLVNTSGKPSAQAMHAQSASMVRVFMRKTWGDDWAQRYGEWLDQCDGEFGTVTVLKAPIERIYAVVRSVCVPCGIIHDPTFPVIDGAVGTSMPLDTCGWVFGSKTDLTPIFENFPLL